MSDLAEAVHGFSFGKRHDGIDQQQMAREPATPRQMGPCDIRVHPPIAMYPLMFQSPFTAGMPYMFDSFLPAGSQGPVAPLAPLSPSYPVVGTHTLHHRLQPSRPRTATVLPGRFMVSAGLMLAGRMRCVSADRHITTWRATTITSTSIGFGMESTFVQRYASSQLCHGYILILTDHASEHPQQG